MTIPIQRLRPMLWYRDPNSANRIHNTIKQHDILMYQHNEIHKGADLNNPPIIVPSTWAVPFFWGQCHQLFTVGPPLVATDTDMNPICNIRNLSNANLNTPLYQPPETSTNNPPALPKTGRLLRLPLLVHFIIVTGLRHPRPSDWFSITDQVIQNFPTNQYPDMYFFKSNGSNLFSENTDSFQGGLSGRESPIYRMMMPLNLPNIVGTNVLNILILNSIVPFAVTNQDDVAFVDQFGNTYYWVLNPTDSFGNPVDCKGAYSRCLILADKHHEGEAGINSCQSDSISAGCVTSKSTSGKFYPYSQDPLYSSDLTTITKIQDSFNRFGFYAYTDSTEPITDNTVGSEMSAGWVASNEITTYVKDLQSTAKMPAKLSLPDADNFNNLKDILNVSSRGSITVDSPDTAISNLTNDIKMFFQLK